MTTLSLLLLSPFAALASPSSSPVDLPAVLVAPSSSWMSAIPDATSLTRLSIPGTHDSGATKGVVWYVCQKESIATQLANGIRFLDVRCRHIEDRFAIHHEAKFEDIMFGDVLNDCKAFLAKYPRECVIMSVKKEYDDAKDTRSFEETFKWYVQNYPGLFYLTDHVPTLGEARGKVVVLRRFGGGSELGIWAMPWKDDTTFTVPASGNACAIVVQDKYGLGTSLNVKAKWREASPALDATRDPANYGSLYINFISAAGSSVDPADAWSCSRFTDMKEHLNTYLGSYPRARLGIVALDFPDDATIRKIIASNAGI